MQSTDFEVIKEIPGYKVILKTVLKSQIQQLVEQLADHTGEESVILTASVSDGSLSHLGSESGKVFLQDHDDLKSQFLGFCLKRHHTQKQNETHQQQESQSNVDPFLTLTNMGPEKRQRFSPLHAPHFQNSSQFSPSPADIHPVALTRAHPQPVSKIGLNNARHEPYMKKRHRKKPERPGISHQDSGSMKLPTEPGTVKDNDASEVLVKVEVSDDQSDLSGVHSSDKSENSNKTEDNTMNQNQISSLPSKSSLSTSQVSLNKDDESNSSSSNIMNDTAGENKTSGEKFKVNPGLVSLGDNMDEIGNTDCVSRGETPEVDPDSGVKVESISESDLELEITGVEPGLMTIPDNWASGVPPGIGYDQGQGQSYLGQSRRASTGGTQEFGSTAKGSRPNEICHEETPTQETQKDEPTTSNELASKATCAGLGSVSLGDLKIVMHECTICGYKTIKKHNLKRHYIVHAEERDYFHCAMCKKVFVTKAGLKRHRKVDHPQ